jgi:hypothetical protein
MEPPVRSVAQSAKIDLPALKAKADHHHSTRANATGVNLKA